jgi:hypothetical protein
MAMTRAKASQVTAKLDATGSTVRGLDDKLAEFVSVKDFGAVGDGVTDDTAAIQAFLDAGGGYVPTGTYLVNDTLIVGNRKYIVGAGSNDVTFQMGGGFGSTDQKPMFALNAAYANPDHNAFNIDSFYMKGVTIRGLATLNASGYPTTLTGPAGMDITWTKDDIILEDVTFRQLNRGLTKRDSTNADVVHWGVRVILGGAFQCYRAYEIFPSLGSIEQVDIQTCNQGILQDSSNATSSTVWLNDLRIECSTSHTLPDTSGFHIKVKSRAEISGYFEGNVRHIWITGANNSHVLIKPSQFSKCSQDAAQTVLGVPILLDTTGTVNSLTLIGVQGVVSSNHQAFIEFGASAAGTLNWAGMGGNSSSIFKSSAGTVSQYPPTDLALVYNNNQRTRGLIDNNNVLRRNNELEWSGSSFGFYTKRYTRRINKTSAGASDIITFIGKTVGRLVVALMDPTTTVRYSHQVFEFYTQLDGTVTAVATVNFIDTNAPTVSASANKFIVNVANTGYTTLAVFLEVTCEAEPDTVVAFN